MKEIPYLLRRLARYSGVFALLLGLSLAFLWGNSFFLKEKGIQLANSTTAILYLPLLLLPTVMAAVVAVMKKKTVTSLSFFVFVLGFVLMVLLQTGSLYSLPFWHMRMAPAISLLAAGSLGVGSMVLALTALRSQSGVPFILGLGLLLIPGSVVGLFVFQDIYAASTIMASFHGLAFVAIGLSLLFSREGKELKAIPKWTLSVIIPATLIVGLSFSINVISPKAVAKNYVEALSGTDLPSDAADLRIPAKPVFGLPQWVVFEAGASEVESWIAEGPTCWQASMHENGKTEFFSKEMGKLYDFWEGKKLPAKYTTMTCNSQDPQSYLLIDQSNKTDWVVYIHICED